MEENSNNVIEHNSVALVERAQIDAQIATAQMYKKHEPNKLSAVKANMLTFATLDEETASGCFYTLPRGGKVIQGPSVRMAEIAISCYGNIRDSVRVIDVVTDDTNPHVIVQAVCHDLESNVAVSIEKRRRIVKKKRKDKIDEDDINLAVNACAAIAFRDAAFKVIPLALIKPVVAAAKKVAIGDIKSLDVTRQKCIDRLNQMGVPTDRILPVVGCLKVEDIGQSELGLLFGLGTALKDGDTSIEIAFPKIDEHKPGVEGLRERIKSEAPETLRRPVESKPVEEISDPEKPRRGRRKGSKNKPKEQGQSETPEPTMTVDDVQPPPEEPPQEQALDEKNKLDDFLYKCKHCGNLFDEPKLGANNITLCPACFSKDIVAVDEI